MNQVSLEPYIEHERSTHIYRTVRPKQRLEKRFQLIQLYVSTGYDLILHYDGKKSCVSFLDSLPQRGLTWIAASFQQISQDLGALYGTRQILWNGDILFDTRFRTIC